jgi:hypothetical protein
MKLTNKIISLLSLVTFTMGFAPMVVAQDAIASLPAVENLTVKSVGNESVTLTWDPVEEAEDYILNHGTESGTVNGVYNRGSQTIDNVTEYTINNLENDQEYFFAIIAHNSDNQVSTTYSNEVSATPSSESGVDQSATPFMANVEAPDDTTIQVTFSEPMVWPEDPIENITVVKRFDNSELGIELVTIVNETTLNLKTAAQAPGAEYSLTINEFFLDNEDNPVDDDKRSKIFLGAISNEEIDNAGNATEFKVDNIVVVDATGIEIIFSRNIVLSDNPVLQFAIVRSDTPSDILQIQEIVKSELAGNKILIKTEPQLNVSYSMLIKDLVDAEGNPLPDDNTTVSFVGYRSTTEIDETAPEDVSNLQLEKLSEDGSSIKLTWDHSQNTNGDLKEYKVYTQEAGGSFNLADSVPADVNEFTLQGLPTDGDFTFKVTALDDFSNESLGVVVNLHNELVISETGPGNLLLLLLAAFLSAYYLKQKGVLAIDNR